MAEITVPIQVNLPDDWVEQIIDRLRNDPEAEWVEVIRCKDCKYYTESSEACGLFDTRLQFFVLGKKWTEDSFCCWAERRDI